MFRTISSTSFMYQRRSNIIYPLLGELFPLPLPDGFPVVLGPLTGLEFDFDIFFPFIFR